MRLSTAILPAVIHGSEALFLRALHRYCRHRGISTRTVNQALFNLGLSECARIVELKGIVEIPLLFDEVTQACLEDMCHAYIEVPLYGIVPERSDQIPFRQLVRFLKAHTRYNGRELKRMLIITGIHRLEGIIAGPTCCVNLSTFIDQLPRFDTGGAPVTNFTPTRTLYDANEMEVWIH